MPSITSPPSSATPAAVFDPYTQNVTFLLGDARTVVQVPIPVLDAFNADTVRTTINYGAQLGACIIMLLVVLLLTPSAKLARAASVLHVVALVLSVVRAGLLLAFYLAPFSHFYPVWAHDLSAVPRAAYDASLAANTLALPVVVVVQAALVHQAWTMVVFWPQLPRALCCAVSALVVLLTVGTRLVFTVIQNHAIVTGVPPVSFFWAIHWTVVMSAVSVFWFCAVFNVKLVSHLVVNRGILPSPTLINPMEALVMTNGFLMIIPAVFAGLEWAKLSNFESASLTITSVVLILPLGTLAAQRISAHGSRGSFDSCEFRKQIDRQPSLPFSSSQPDCSRSAPATEPSQKAPSSSGYGTAPTPQAAFLTSRPEVSLSSRAERMDPVDLELSRIDACRESSEFSHQSDHGKRLRREDFA